MWKQTVLQRLFPYLSIYLSAEVETRFEDLGTDKRVIIKLILKKCALRIGLNLTDSRQDVVAGSCKHGHEQWLRKKDGSIFTSRAQINFLGRLPLSIYSYVCCGRTKMFPSRVHTVDLLDVRVIMSTLRNVQRQLPGVVRLRLEENIFKKVKVKLSLCLIEHCHEDVGEWGYSFIILDLGTRWRWVVSFTLWLLHPREKRLRYPLDMRLSGPQSHSGHFGEETKSCPCRDSNPGCPARR
jgi:hypothetical protein